MTSTLRRARILGYEQLQDIEFADGVISAITPSSEAVTLDDAGGRVVMSGLVDAHVHLDKAYVMPQLEELGAFESEGIGAAIAATRKLRDTMKLADMRAGMERTLTGLVDTGTVAARIQVEVDPSIDPASVREHQDIGGQFPGIELQLVAFPQNGTSSSPQMQHLMERALDDGCTVVGGCSYADSDPERHLDLVFALARERDLPVDLHLDLTDDPELAELDLVIPRIERAGLQGRVTVAHMTALSATPPDLLARRMADLARLDVAVVSIPTTDLWLSGRDHFPTTRGVAPIKKLMAAGVRVALASNNYQNAFTPVGAGGLLRVAWLASLVGHMGDPRSHEALLEAVTSVPAGILGLGPWGVQVGSRAPLLVLDAREPLDAVREAPRVLRVVRGS